MATIKKMASTAKKRAKKAAVMSMTVMAMNAAIADMQDEYKQDYIPMDGTMLNYTWDPFDGFCA